MVVFPDGGDDFRFIEHFTSIGQKQREQFGSFWAQGNGDFILSQAVRMGVKVKILKSESMYRLCCLFSANLYGFFWIH